MFFCNWALFSKWVFFSLVPRLVRGTYILQCLGYEPMTFKAEQRVPVRHMYEGKNVFLWLLAAFGKLLRYETLPFVFDVMQ